MEAKLERISIVEFDKILDEEIKNSKEKIKDKISFNLFGKKFSFKNSSPNEEARRVYKDVLKFKEKYERNLSMETIAKINGKLESPMRLFKDNRPGYILTYFPPSIKISEDSLMNKIKISNKDSLMKNISPKFDKLSKDSLMNIAPEFNSCNFVKKLCYQT